jgi:hypothetical protein
VCACTDSLCYHVKHDNVYEVMRHNLDAFDTIDYPNDKRGLHSMANAKVVGVFKDECNGVAPAEFVGLRAKMYSLLVNKDEKPKLTAKGVKRSYVKRHVTHDMYLHTLCSRQPTSAEFLTFRSKNHRLQTLKMKKTCLSAFDDKRFILADGVSSLPYGHYRIGQQGFK